MNSFVYNLRLHRVNSWNVAPAAEGYKHLTFSRDSPIYSFQSKQVLFSSLTTIYIRRRRRREKKK